MTCASCRSSARTCATCASSRCDLSRAALSNSTLQRVELRGCTLDGIQSVTDLRGASMPWPDILDNAGVLAAALGIALVVDDDHQGDGA